MSPPAVGVVCLGDLMTDIVALASGPPAPGSDTRALVRVSGGGSAANTAAWLGALGHRVAFAGRAGDDVLGRAAVAELRRLGVDARVVLDTEIPTGACVVVVGPDGERTMYPDAGANAALSSDDLPLDLLGEGWLLHLSGYSLLNDGSRPAALAALATARALGARVSVDPSSVVPVREVGVDRVTGWLTGSDLLLANDDEACLLAGRPGDPLGAGLDLARTFGEVVVKQGPGGASWFRTGSAPCHVPAVDVDVVDTTGAGDAFAAGFLPPWLGGEPPEVALAAGCALAARVVAKVGARPDR